MPEKPSYLGLLNAIAVGEARGQMLFDAWAENTDDAELAPLLRMVAIREHEHAAAFTKRLCELGYSVQDRPADDFEMRLAMVRSAASDREKFERVFGYPKRGSDEALRGIFDDESIDIATGELLGRFIAEERDTGRRLQGAYAKRAAAADAATPDLDDIALRLERLTRTVEKLKAQRRDER